MAHMNLHTHIHTSYIYIHTDTDIKKRGTGEKLHLAKKMAMATGSKVTMVVLLTLTSLIYIKQYHKRRRVLGLCKGNTEIFHWN